MLKICSFFFLDATFIFLIRCCVYWKYKEFFTRKLVLQGSAIKLVIRSIYSCMTVRDSIGKCSQCCFCLESRSQNHSSFWSNFHLLHKFITISPDLINLPCQKDFSRFVLIMLKHLIYQGFLQFSACISFSYT